MKNEIVTITFESNDCTGKKSVLTITNDIKLRIEFMPEIHKDEKALYGKYLNCFIDMLTNK